MRGLIIVLALIGLIGGGGYALREYAPQYLPDQWTTDTVLKERIREGIGTEAHADAFFTKFEQLFPADYNELMTQLVALYRRGGSETQALTLGKSYMRQFIEDNQSHVANAEPAVLTELGRSITQGITVLRQEDASMCGEAFRAGAGFNLPVEGMSPTAQDAFWNISLVMLDGIASGKRTPTEYAAPSEAQWVGLISRYEALGGDRRALEASASEAQMRMMPAAQVCTLVEHMWMAALQAEDDFVPRFVSHSMRQG